MLWKHSQASASNIDSRLSTAEQQGFTSWKVCTPQLTQKLFLADFAQSRLMVSTFNFPASLFINFLFKRTISMRNMRRYLNSHDLLSMNSFHVLKSHWDKKTSIVKQDFVNDYDTAQWWRIKFRESFYKRNECGAVTVDSNSSFISVSLNSGDRDVREVVIGQETPK